uniref:GPI alpha-1,4-mannosyltransferase I, catalytic subunit n=1 Tax=Caenorhabditis tropicalis TaxID=1561998 RepID=A0A1I7T7F2_9PELO
MQCVRSFVKNESFSRNRILIIALAARITLILYAHIHDYLFKVNFTDIDYHVFSDAAEHVSKGGSPFDRETYRYTPALAWILLPVVKFPDFGKTLFCIFDIIVALLYFKIMEKDLNETKGDARTEMENDQTMNVVIYWLANPLTAIISARGNAESIVSAIVLFNLILLQKGYWKSAALVHGSLAIQFKIYPLIYLPSVFLSLSSFGSQKDIGSKIKSLFTNWKGFAYVIITLTSFGSVVAFFYQIYGQLFLDEYLIYHIKRRDLAHNFSPYFYLLYLYEGNPTMSQIIGLGAFLPQLVLTVVFAFKHYEDLPFCWFITTFAFVAYNKVCTSQYFVWYIVLLPLLAHKIHMTRTRAITLMAAWFATQGIWLLTAYLFEFQGYNTFFLMFLASCLFLITNSIVLKQIINNYVPITKEKAD